jgi:SAM-dependent methyltransferase
MHELELQETCRLSGEPLAGAPVLAEIEACPLPGIYPPDASAARSLRSPLRVVQAPGSGFVQLAHSFDDSGYRDYGFAATTSIAYEHHLRWFADEVAAAFAPTTPVLEVGCGDGLLLDLLEERGFPDRVGIDPGRAAAASERSDVVHGFFPQDLPGERRYGLIVLRHVLEHIESPVPFLTALAERLLPGGEVWIEVPDLDATLRSELWSNFYQLHCNYFSAPTLDASAARAGLACTRGQVVDVFGGSLLRRYRVGATDAAVATAPVVSLAVTARFEAFRTQLAELAEWLPTGAVGYGAAERTAMTLGAAPALAAKLTCLHDGNPLLAGRYLAGTPLPIRGKHDLWSSTPPAVVLFALSHRNEILAEWREHLPGETLVAVAGGDFARGPLASLELARVTA